MFKKEKQQDEKSTNKLRLIVYLFAVAAILSGIVNVVSKYVHTNNEQKAIKAQEFYFESDLLFEEGKEYEISSGTSTITFKLSNYPDDLRFSEGDITYKVEVTESSNVVYKTDGTLVGGKNTSVEVTFPVETGKIYTVTATGTRGFKKVSTGTFKVESEEELIYKSIEQTNEYVLLTVWTKNVSGNVEITFPNGLIPDNTNDALKNVKTSDEQFTDTVNFQKPYSSYRYRFFKTNNIDYNANNFDVSCADITAIAETPVE